MTPAAPGTTPLAQGLASVLSLLLIGLMAACLACQPDLAVTGPAAAEELPGAAPNPTVDVPVATDAQDNGDVPLVEGTSDALPDMADSEPDLPAQISPTLVGACNDGNACTTGDLWLAETCTGSPVSCDDSNGCTVDACAVDIGCTHSPTASACEGDGDGCTLEVCISGACTATAAKNACGDGNPCTIDTCSAGACNHAPGPDNAVCLAGAITELVAIPDGPAAVGLVNSKGVNGPGMIFHVPAFRIQKHEVTVGQYAVCVAAGLCDAPQIEPTSGYADSESVGVACNWGHADRAKHPLNCLGRSQAKAFCAYLGGRLPTDPEYDKAMRGGCELFPPLADCLTTTPKSPWGWGPAINGVNYYDPGGWGNPVCPPAETCPVGTFPAGASPYGVHDLCAQLWELVVGPYTDYANWPYYDPPTDKVSLEHSRWPFDQMGLPPDWKLFAYPRKIPDGTNWSSTYGGFRCRLPPAGP